MKELKSSRETCPDSSEATNKNCLNLCRRKLRKAVAVLRQECRRYAKGVDELLGATGGWPATIYEYADGSAAYFAPDAADFAKTGELKGKELAAAQRILDERGLPGGNTR